MTDSINEVINHTVLIKCPARTDTLAYAGIRKQKDDKS